MGTRGLTKVHVLRPGVIGEDGIVECRRVRQAAALGVLGRLGGVELDEGWVGGCHCG